MAYNAEIVIFRDNTVGLKNIEWNEFGQKLARYKANLQKICWEPDILFHHVKQRLSSFFFDESH